MATSTVPVPSQLQTESRTSEAFPELTPAQLARVEPHGRRRRLAQGEVVGEPGQPVTKIYVVLSGQLDALTPLQASTANMPRFTPGMFTGERSILSGGRFLGRISATVPTEVIEVERDELLKLIQTDTELSDIFLRAFILRRLQLIDRGYGDVDVLGSQHCSGTLHIREFLTRNGHPYTQRDLDTDAESQELLDRFHLTPEDVPVVICRGKNVLKNPTIQQLANCLGLNPTLDRTQIWDVVIIGAGPAGLGAGVYAASEGLNAVIIEANAPGGQAGTSSRIENYLGFPLGISGQELAARAYDLAQKFGAKILTARKVARLDCSTKAYGVQCIEATGHRLLTRAIVIARVVESLCLAVEKQNIRHVFTMTGAEPSTKWLAGCLALDAKGFIKTGAALTADDLAAAKWPLRRPPYLLETSLPGVLAVGDVRSGSTKRVASAVGEGSIAVASVHQILAE